MKADNEIRIKDVKFEYRNIQESGAYTKEQIEKWKEAQAYERTKLLRPDLLEEK